MSYVGPNSNTVAAYSQGYPPAVSLTAQSTIQAGTALDGLCTRSTGTMVVTTSAGVTAGSVQAMASLDGVSWFNAGSAVSTTVASTSTQVTISNVMARFIRANIVTGISGGTVSVSVGLYG